MPSSTDPDGARFGLPGGWQRLPRDVAGIAAIPMTLKGPCGPFFLPAVLKPRLFRGH